MENENDISKIWLQVNPFYHHSQSMLSALLSVYVIWQPILQTQHGPRSALTSSLIRGHSVCLHCRSVLESF